MGQSMDSPLAGVPQDELAAYLSARSNLPGPRANLSLADEFARIAHRGTILRFACADDEYLRFCGTEALGRLLSEDPTDSALEQLLRTRATDPLWRVREGASRALQIMGDTDRQQLRAIVAHWIRDTDPLVRRAAVTAICEPRLLNDELTAQAAVEACRIGTRSIKRLPSAERSRPAVRTLRQGLGYCWSVAVAAYPARGMNAFDALRDDDDADVKWIVASNLGKARLKRLLNASDTP